MRVDKELITRLVAEIVGQLSQERPAEHILVIGSRNDDVGKALPSGNTLSRKLFFSAEGDDTERIDRYILPCLQLNDMADLALGKAVSPDAVIIRNLLLAGKTVEVLEYAYKECENTAPPPLYHLYCQYDETLRSFGLSPVHVEVKRVSLTKKVISEKDLEKCRAGGITRIDVSSSSIVTSLAKDYARQYRIEIQRSERGTK